MSEWVLLAANCDCCAPSTPYPVSFVFTRFDGLFGYTSFPGIYITDLGSVDVEIEITWSDGSTTTETPTTFQQGWTGPAKVHSTTGNDIRSSGQDVYQADFSIAWPAPGDDDWAYRVSLATSDAVGRSFAYVKQ